MSVSITLPTLHADQARALRLKVDARRGNWDRNVGGQFKAVRCGRRWGKTKLGETWVGDGALKEMPCGWFAPDYKRLSEVYAELKVMLAPMTLASSKTDGVIRLEGGGRIDFWTLEDESAGRSRMYKRVVIDEGAFTKANMLDIWRKSIQPTLLDLDGSCLVASNTNGVSPENFLYQICRDPKYGFVEYHAPTANNPTIPVRRPGETPEEQTLRRLAAIARVKAREHPLVFAQEYLAEFVDWSGVAFFDKDKLLVDGRPVPMPLVCDRVFAVVDTAVKTGSANDGTAVLYLARNMTYGTPLVILDWDIQQIAGNLLPDWLPNVFRHLEYLAKLCKARYGSGGAFVEDAQTGQVLIQHAQSRRWPVVPIDSALTSIGKDERALAVSSFHYQGLCKIAEPAYDKVINYKGVSANHLMTQITGFRVGDKAAAKRADDLLDTYCYALSLALGNKDGV